MKEVDLAINPYWQAKDLGKAIPSSHHAVSVSLPHWQDVVNYEEKQPQCINKLSSVYPRFGFNPFIREISEKVLGSQGKEEWTAWPYPNLLCAESARNYCQSISPLSKYQIINFLGLTCLITDKEASQPAKSFWQHTGLGASSRQAAIALGREIEPSPEEGTKSRQIVCNRLKDLYGCRNASLTLHPSGMAALTTALNLISILNPNRPTIQIGFPYVDVLKLPQVIFTGGILLQKTDLRFLEDQFKKYKPSAVIVELPSNPMLECVNLIDIANLAHRNNIIVIVDDTIGSAININSTPYADIIFSSLTKSFAGSGDIMAGSLLISPYSRWEKELSKLIPKVLLTILSDSDSIALEKASKDYKYRIPKLNTACVTLKRHLESHKAIKRVLHPELCKNFQSLLKEEGGYGCLLSFELKGGMEQAKKVYNSLKVCKGPSFGTSFTLVSPYVLLAHYQELKWAEKCGVPPHLLRVSVGLEEPEDLWSRFQKALDA